MTAIHLPVLCVALATAGVAIKAQQQVPRFTDRVDVARVIVDVRALNDRGDPILGLTADDFKVRIDGRTARVETATWVGGRDTTAGPPPLEHTSPDTDSSGARAGRLIVFLFQKDLEPSRIVGLMRMLLKSRDLLETLSPEDRVAVLSFDTQLKIWADFTNDTQYLDRLFGRGVLLEKPPSSVEANPELSLVRRLSPEKARRTYTVEHALELIADALEPLPGSKSLVLIGHGFGRLTQGAVMMENGYGEAREALVAARTSVFSLDVTEADYHSLEAGLQLISKQTGGFFARTHIFPDAAMRRLSGALAGYYVLFVEAAESRRPTHDVSVELAHRGGRALAATAYTQGWR